MYICTVCLYVCMYVCTFVYIIRFMYRWKVNKDECSLVWSSDLSLVDNESQMQHAACWQWYHSDSRTAQDADSVVTLTKHGVLIKPCALFNVCHLLYYYLFTHKKKNVSTTGANDGCTYIAWKMITDYIISLKSKNYFSK